MKRLLSMLLALVMVFSMVPQAAFAAEGHVISETALVVGSNNVTLDSAAGTTVFAFDAAEKAMYSFSVNNGVVGYWGSNEWFLTDPGSTSTSIEMECIVGPTYYIGVTGAGSCVLTVTKTGEAKPDPITTEYKLVNTPSAAKMACYTVDGTGSATVVNFNHEIINLNGMLGAPTSIKGMADNNYDYVDYRPALEAYGAAASASGNYYILTDELAMILNELYVAKSWNTMLSSVSDLYAKATVSHTAGDAVVEDGVSKVFCTVCGALLSSQAVEPENVCAHKDVKHVAAVAPACHYQGNIEYWVCYECESWWQDEALTQVTNSKNVILPALGGEVVAHEAVEAGCHFDGNIAYWTCSECEQVWQDEALTQLTNSKNVILPATGGEVAHVEAKAATCEEPGNVEYWTCSECEKVWTDEALTQLSNIKNVVLPVAHAVEHVEAKAATCEEPGNIEYWYCTECGSAWTDELLREVTNLKNVVLPVSHNIDHIEAVAATCHDDGNVEYWYCMDCGYAWTDELLHEVTNLKSVTLPALGGEVVAHEAVEPGCHYEGNIAYWTCGECEKVWADEALTQLTNIKNVVVPAVGGEVVHVEAVEPSCFEPGNVEHWYCEKCEQVWTDEALTQLSNHKNVIVAAAHEIEHIEAVTPTCHDDGNVEYWYCTECGYAWTDELLREVTNLKSIIVPATGEGNVVHMEAVEPGCHYTGNVEYWICYECEKVWTDEALTQLSNTKNVVVPAKETTATKVEAKAPTCSANGNVAYWTCEECEQVWADEALTQLTNIKNVTIAKDKDAHTVEKWVHICNDKDCDDTVKCADHKYKGTCEGCGKVQYKTVKATEKHVDKDKDDECDACGVDLSNAKTGDMIIIAVVVMALAAAAIVVLLTKKRRED